MSKDLCKMVGYNIGEGDVGNCRRPYGSQPLSWGHLPNGGTVANLGKSNLVILSRYLATFSYF